MAAQAHYPLPTTITRSPRRPRGAPRGPAARARHALAQSCKAYASGRSGVHGIFLISLRTPFPLSLVSHVCGSLSEI